MKKLCFLLFLLTVTFFSFIIQAGLGYQKQAAAAMVGSRGNSDSERFQVCKYVYDGKKFRKETEKQRSYVIKKIPPYYVNAVLASYQEDGKTDIKDVVEIFLKLIKTGLFKNVDSLIQGYRYGEDYGHFLKEKKMEHSLAASRQYFNERFLNKEKHPNAYTFYKRVIMLIDKDCHSIEVSGEWIKPLEKFVITQEFGVSEFSGGLHYGIDLVDTYGAPVFAVHEAMVYETGTGCSSNGGYLGNMCNQGRGNYIYLKVPSGKANIYIYYFHLSKIAVKQGDQVIAGEEIGVQGNSGNSTGSHLHFEMRTKPLINDKDSTLNPHEYIDFFK